MRRITVTSTSMAALAAALLLAGCNSHAPAANDAAMNDTAMMADNAADNAAAAVPPEDLALPAGDSAVVEDASTAPPIQVVEVPTPAPSAPAADTAPLTDALAAEQLIDAGTGITRVQQADGWAWMQDGQIIRTASADGHRVSYFRRGSTTPYFVQQDGRSYGYSNGKPTREYDDHGRPQAPDAQHQREAQSYADQARQQHDRAQQASKTAPHVDRGRPVDHQAPGNAPPQRGDNTQPNGGHNAPSGTDHGSPNDNNGHNGHNGHAAPTPHPMPTPTPTPTPTPSRHGHQPQSDGHTDHQDHGSGDNGASRH